MNTFSVLICTYNRPNLLSMALVALIECTIEKPDQVIVVNGGDSRSDAIVQKYMNRLGVQVELVKTVNVNLAVSRNIGFSHCSGDIIATTDDDAEVLPDWVTQMKRIHAEHPEAGGVGGVVLGAGSDKSLLDRIADVAIFPASAQPSYVRTLAGVNISYKRIAMDAVGLQDESLFRGEDVDYNWRIKRAGYEIFYSPEIKVIHHHRSTFRGLVYQFHMYGRAYYLVRRKWPEMYSVYPHEITSIKHIIKAINFVVRIFYEPLFHAFKLRPWYLWPVVYIVMLASGSAWSCGVIFQWVSAFTVQNSAGGN